jgi:hypothetical protein
MKDIVRDYIENEIDYIKGSAPLDEYDIRDLYMLQNMSDEQINEIADNVYDELEDKINELIHEYLYGSEGC